MGIMNAVAKAIFRPKALSVTDEKAWNPSLWRFAAYNDSGVDVDEHSALNYSAVFCAINLISGTIGTLPLHLIKQTGRKKEYKRNHPLYRVMHDQANPYMTATDLRETQMAHVLGWGNGYAEIVRNNMGQVIQLWPIPPNRITPRMYEGELVYEVIVDNETKYLPRDRVLHLHGLGFDGFLGYSVIRMAAQSIGLAMAMESFGSRFFANGTHPGVVAYHPGKLSPDSHKNLRDDLMSKHSGLGKAHRLMLLEEGMKIEKIGIPPEEAQFLQSRQHQIPEVARWFNLPPHKLRDLSRSSFNNIESEQISFIVDSISPWCYRSEQSYNAQLLSDQEKRSGLYFKHSVEGHLRGDSKSRSEFYQKLWQIGAISQNEIREKEDLSYDENPMADERFVPMNMMPLSKIDEYLNRSKENENNEPEHIQTDGTGELPGGEQE